MVESIRVVISTLNGIEVKGKNNLSGLLGCINVLEEIAQILENPPTEEMTEEQEEEDV